MRAAALSALVAIAAVAATADAPPFARTEQREPCASYDPLRQPYFGDTHVHTAFSFDAWGQGTLAGPRDAYRFARGEEIGMQPFAPDGRGQTRIQLRRALDFAVVTDHSDLLGETQICQDPALSGYDSLVCRVVRRFPKLGYTLVNGFVYSSENPARYSFCGKDGADCRAAGRGPWREIQDAAEAYYDRSAACRFTTFVGYEWTGMPAGDNLHRNVIFRNQVAQAYPTTYIETPTAEGLWRALESECLGAGNGCDVLAIPHNSNVSNGRMFTATRSDGAPLTTADARERAKLEMIAEVTQHKGDSECRAGGEDELCSYEKLAMARMQDMAGAGGAPLPPRIYLREALGLGLELERKLGVNPFKLGLIGSTDTHLATPGMVDEDQFRGHAAGTVTVRWGVPPYPDRPDFNPGGLAVLWAEENSRDALFEAMRRREVYGTSGPRIAVRFFGGWGYADDLCAKPDFAAQGYAGGVPMGGDLPPASPTAKAPRFAVWALRDPGANGAPSAPLQRIQIVKGWVADGESRERVYEVAGDPASGAGLDLASCTPAPGADQLCRVWTDPDFDANAPAFYYARVVENPSCRWNTWACNAHHVDCANPESVPSELAACCDASVPKSIQERAWTSPIWYTPD
jgi:Protein of unknown function (DUF3604)